MSDDQILKLQREARAAGVRFGFALAVGVVRAHLAALDNPDVSAGIPADVLAARRDQLERVLETMAEREREL